MSSCHHNLDCRQTDLTHQHRNRSFPSWQVCPWSCPGRVPATTEAKLCRAILWRSEQRDWVRPQVGLNSPPVAKAPPTTSAQAWSLWKDTASGSEPTTRQGSVNQARNLSVSRWPLQVSTLNVQDDHVHLMRVCLYLYNLCVQGYWSSSSSSPPTTK